MATIIEDFRIDIAKVQSFKYLQAKQYDHISRKRKLIITDSNVPITYSNDRHEYIVMSMLDGGDNYANVQCPFEDDGFPYITFTENMLSHSGDIECEIRIYDFKDGTIITTFTFNIEITPSLLSRDRLVNSQEFDILNNLVLQALAIPGLYEKYSASLNELNILVQNLRTDIDNYRIEFTNLSNEAQGLISDVETFLNDAQIAESNRVNAEIEREKAEDRRQQDTTNKINDIEHRTTAAIDLITDRADTVIANANTAITNAENATQLAQNATNKANDAADIALKNANDANEARKLCLDAIESLHWELVELDGGNAHSNEDDYENTYDNGEA